MPLTADDIVKAFAQAGVDSPEAFGAFIGHAATNLAVSQKQAEIAQAQNEQSAAQVKYEERLSELRAELAALEAARDGTGG